MVLALALGFGIFFFLPLWFSQLLGVKKEALAFNLIAGCARVTLFIAYVWVISWFGEFKKIFQYHGAEHKSIFTFEAGKELTVENVKGFSTRHPRCGTSFILIVVVFYFLLIRPQQKRQKEQKAMISAIRKGDKVVTTSGIFGTIVGMDDQENKVVLKIAENVKVEFLKSSIAGKVGTE